MKIQLIRIILPPYLLKIIKKVLKEYFYILYKEMVYIKKNTCNKDYNL